ncbi:hypothetical protein B0H66DRAFT_599919 [Apodospora peruviana]|uniref:Essential protein Yae1 N-terminal domain-containing protein n=1 Tax=Apodospora peruviana TaxID=516989 RepID=A0AAE0IIM1_9PEZI|nr:hypothetical protein B0H66DRAFT_599919 [Apodospora peruviana]
MANHNTDDPFENILNLEEQFYQEGYKQGQQDGVTAGRSEGRSLGLEKGFQKFAESGMLYGRAIVWANRMRAEVKTQHEAGGSSETSGPSHQPAQKSLPSLPSNARLEKHITTLYALVETDTLSTENTDDAVNDFDDRLKRAQGRAKIIERLVGEGGGTGSSSKSTGKAQDGATASPPTGKVPVKIGLDDV